MKVFGRNIKISESPQKFVEIAQMAIRSVSFKRPLKLWSAYFRGVPPPGNQCELRNGSIIQLSSNPHDIITVMVNFCKSEYGRIERDWVVVDIGGNIGVFSVYASLSGAAKVSAVEPNREAYEVLTKNISLNGLGDRVSAKRNAVGAKAGILVRIPNSSSPYNKVATDFSKSDDFEEVETITLSMILAELEGGVDLMKLDCEGAEYDILLNAKSEELSDIKRIRMELHGSKSHTREDVVNHLTTNGFSLTKKSGTIYWLERK